MSLSLITLELVLRNILLNDSWLLGLLVPKPQHTPCMQRTHSVPPPPIRVLPCHCDTNRNPLKWGHRGEKGKPCTYFETLCLYHMSSARSTSDGRGPVTRKRVPDRDEQGKPSKDARRGRCHPLEAGILYPCG